MLTLAEAYLHQIDPYAIQLWEGGPIRWYGLSYLLGFFLAYLLVRRVARVGASPLTVQRAADLIVTLAIGVVVGGRLGYVVFYRPELLVEFSSQMPWWGVLAINEGGMASHGGMIGGVLACFWFAWKFKLDWAFTFDLLAFGAPLGLFFGRIANFINGELIGRKAQPIGLNIQQLPLPKALEDFLFWFCHRVLGLDMGTPVPWAVKFPQEIYSWRETAPEKIDALSPLIREYGGTRAIVAEVQRGNTAVIEHLRPLLDARHPSQLYAALMEGLIVFAVLLWVWRKPRMPGLVASWFAISYGVMRIIDEIWRRPDVHLLDDEFQWLHITRGQWLSALLLAVGVWGVWFAQRRRTEPMGSWRRGPWTKEPTSAKEGDDADTSKNASGQ